VANIATPTRWRKRASRVCSVILTIQSSTTPGSRRLFPSVTANFLSTPTGLTLRQGLNVAPKNAILHHALGLALVRLNRSDEALRELERATALEPGNARFAYVYAVALHSTGRVDAAIAKLEKALLAHPNDRDIVTALASFHQARGEHAAANRHAERLKSLDNEKATSGK